MEFEPILEATIDIAASPETVWSLVSDVRRMGEWSPQVTSTRLREGYSEIALGTEFTNRNVEGDVMWTTHGEIVRFEACREIAFRIAENRAIWSFRLAPIDGGTRLIQRRDTPEGLSDFSLESTETYFGGQAAFTETLRSGMRTTLAAIKRDAENALGTSPGAAATSAAATSAGEAATGI